MKDGKPPEIRHIVFIHVGCSKLVFQLNSPIGHLDGRDLPEGWKNKLLKVWSHSTLQASWIQFNITLFSIYCILTNFSASDPLGDCEASMCVTNVNIKLEQQAKAISMHKDNMAICVTNVNMRLEQKADRGLPGDQWENLAGTQVWSNQHVWRRHDGFLEACAPLSLLYSTSVQHTSPDISLAKTAMAKNRLVSILQDNWNDNNW